MKYLVGGVVLVALIALGLAFMPRNTSGPTPASLPADTNRYDSATYGISFMYPPGFVLEEREVGNGERRHYAITIRREVDATLPVNGEGPTGVTIDLYQNDIDQQSVVAWMNGASVSNFKLGPGTYATTSVDGVESFTYRWSGLYEGETTAFMHRAAIVAVSGTFMTPDDETIDAYRMVLETLMLAE